MKKDKDKTIKLEASEYWEWRTTIAEMQLANTRLNESELFHKLLGKDTELAQLKYQLFARSTMESVKQKSREFKEEYDSFKKKLESKYNISLSEKVIDDFTFEVRNLPPENGKET